MPAKKNSLSGRSHAENDDLLTALRKFIRTKAEDYLEDPNISSIGVGYKQVDGKSTGEIAVQFTVNEKVSGPEALDALGTSTLPETIIVDGIVVPTDVLQRRYEPAFRLVAEAAAPERKSRLDPVVPGISVAHPAGTAGTIGCVVYDRDDGTPYVLSNWHVLHTAAGVLGDDAVQPGPRDDNRIDRNRLGKLVRSHLGTAGDCAVATIENRQFSARIAGLDVVPDSLGEPELGDKVIKSGRTTRVTHGIVRRVDVVAEISYGGVGSKRIGGFEIGPDPDNPPFDGEISSSGDSGSAWMFTLPGGETSTVLAGLHFAGEMAPSTDEHALACLPQSVFEKLGITLTPPVADEVAVLAGYDPHFLASAVPLPEVDTELRPDVATALDGADVLHYTHFSLAMRRSRRFAIWVAWNIDGASMKKLSRKKIDFVKDPRLDAQAQVGNELYRDNRLDRGHLARRADLLWGSLPEAAKANKDSFFYTNITPQMDDFNQSTRDGIWGRLEDAVFADVDVDDLKVSAFGGPVCTDDDREFRQVKIPREFWKVIAFEENGVLKARGFLLSQNLQQLEALELDEFRVFQVPLTEIEQRARFRFPQALHDADLQVAPEEVAAPLISTTDIRW
ncbi:DNA/RNA non-specific endonuclease [Streptomyces gardneri]|uniref:DNA/RNA non-specific endonuclease n=1 Tax=Nocardia TaxID=1817 RepID=UPI001359D3D2|nr:MULTISPECIES: DNA/RNA non-specific endonuclease [Nocardia]MBF6164939.1 DNA/RNA non-specific endonuclease [Streptomyces gardneri]MBF6208146.1 DNA/RNA non-specific endonuclease [Streptomyces gardneri]